MEQTHHLSSYNTAEDEAITWLDFTEGWRYRNVIKTQNKLQLQ